MENLPSVALLCGGRATRLAPETDTLPKSLVSVAGEPFLAHQLRLLYDQGVRHVVLCVGHYADQIMAFIETAGSFGLKIEFSLDGEMPKGTGGAVQQAIPLLGEMFFVLYGDSYLLHPFRSVYQAFCQSRQPGLMTVLHNQNRWDTSNVVLSDGMIARYDKTEPSDPLMQYIDYGLSVLSAQAFVPYCGEQPYALEKVFQDLVAKRGLAGWVVSERFYEIGSHQGLKETAQYLESVVGEPA